MGVFGANWIPRGNLSKVVWRSLWFDNGWSGFNKSIATSNMSINIILGQSWVFSCHSMSLETLGYVFELIDSLSLKTTVSPTNFQDNLKSQRWPIIQYIQESFMKLCFKYDRRKQNRKRNNESIILNGKMYRITFRFHVPGTSWYPILEIAAPPELLSNIHIMGCTFHRQRVHLMEPLHHHV